MRIKTDKSCDRSLIHVLVLKLQRANRLWSYNSHQNAMII